MFIHCFGIVPPNTFEAEITLCLSSSHFIFISIILQETVKKKSPAVYILYWRGYFEIFFNISYTPGTRNISIQQQTVNRVLYVYQYVVVCVRLLWLSNLTHTAHNFFHKVSMKVKAILLSAALEKHSPETLHFI